MNKQIYFIILLSIFIVGCDSLLDLEPEGTIVEDQVFEKFATTDAAVAGTYHLLFQAACNDYIMAEATSPTCDYSSSAARAYDEINNGTVLPEDDAVETIYFDYYAALVQANLIIYKIAELGKYDEELMNKHIAEAKFIRAFAFHKLLVWYGDGALKDKPQNNGVVLYLNHYDGFDRSTDLFARNTNEEVYQQIITDLTEAHALLDAPEVVETLETKVSRANKAMCEALLSRVYLYKRDYANAALWANELIVRNEYSLESNLLNVFPSNEEGTVIPFSTEHVFGFPVSSNGGNWQFGGNDIYYVNDSYWYSDDFITEFKETDLRKTNMMHTFVTGDKTVYVTNKYPNLNGRDNLTMIRLPEVLLTRAEASARESNSLSQQMIDDLNSVYLRSNPMEEPYTLSSFSSLDDFIDEVLLERSKELAFEGCSRFDRLRTDRTLYNENLDDNKMVLPIPLAEIQVSDGVIVQNEGYK